MNIILDSDVIIECLRGNTKIIERIRKWHSSKHVISYTPVSLAEIHAGVRPGEEKTIRYFFQNLNFIAIDEKIGIKAGEYLQEYGKSHAVEIADALIGASTCLYADALFTRNKKHYPMDDIRLQ